MEPVGQKKPYDSTKLLQIQCPSQENPYFFTYRNSNYSPTPETSNIKERSQERSYGTNVPCSNQSPSDTVPVSVHNLRPADIQVIAALGDSLTAGNGAGSNPHDVLDVLTQYRGLSWSVGGNENISTVTTLANILREFNPSLIGYSTGTGRETTENAALNQAVAGDKSEDVPAQVRRLVDRMKNDTRINMQTDWKLVTLFIGGNDLCKFCEDPIRYSPENYTYNIQIALDMLHREVPRTFVNLVTVLSITSLRELYAEKNVSCPRILMRLLCPCVLKYADNSTEVEQLVNFNKRYQERTKELVESGRYDTREDFTVVLQPFLTHVDMPKTQEGFPDNSYFAPDCFHFSQKSHSQAARALWNNMVRYCLIFQAEPFLRTYKNSNYTYPSQIPVSTNISIPLLLCCICSCMLVVPLAALWWMKQNEAAAAAMCCQNCDSADLTRRGTDIFSLRCHLSFSDIFREFNAMIEGYSTGTGSVNDLNAFLNQAVPGAEAEHLPTQARALLRLMQTDSRIDFNADWKIITVFIGGNDLCNYCKDPVPKALVNLVEVIDILPLRQLFVDTQVPCPTYLFLCRDVDGLLVAGFGFLQLGVQGLVESGRYDTHENFTVIIQPFLRNPTIPLDQDGHPDVSYFSPDCFHPNQKGHSQLARALWNALLQPVGQKADSFNFMVDAVLSCPTQVNIPMLWKMGIRQPYMLVQPADSRGSICLGQLSLIMIFLLPLSVHELQPADIKVIGALGDSLTVSTAMVAELILLCDSVLSLCSIGGDGTLETQTTLPNILKKFSPNIFGFSTGSSKETAGFNVAQRGATARNMSAQARELVELMRSSSEINFKEDWKLITILVGGNDLCQYCFDKVCISEAGVLVWALGRNICPCFLNPKENSSELQEIKRVNRDFQLVNSGRYEQREDFAVVVQPFFRNTVLPLDRDGKPDLSFFAADCFHFSRKGYAEMAMALWNNMMEPVGEKQTYNNFTYDRSKLKCPTPDKPFLSTVRNSGFRNSVPNTEKTEPSVPYWAVIVAAVAGVLVGSALIWAVSRRTTRHRRETETEKNMKTTSL
uniref:Phospholipase B1, membrane-associated n=1 Tax=Anas zonorhyncha TaxID=75864 RepID=A0A8B9VN08_9AVES